jgi:uncharacterized spore protein YtfJ
MRVDELLDTARESLTVKRVFGEAFEQDGVTLIPTAAVAGGFGGGKGADPKGQEGEGGGFGMTGRPVGVFMMRNGELSWRPAVDVNRALTITGLAVVTYLLMRPRLARVRAST